MNNVIKAIQSIYPEINGGFVYWQTKQDGTPHNNPIDGLIWENTEFEKPTWEQIESKLSGIDLQEAKDKKELEIKALRKANLLKSTPQTITYSGNLENKTFNINENDIDKFTTIIASLQDDIDNGAVNPTRNWSDETGERLSLDINDFKSLRKHLNLRDEQEFDQARLKIEALELLETIEEIEAFDITQVIV